MAKRKQRKVPQGWLGKAWHFIWHDDSLLSWLLNIVVIFILIKFLVYPGLGLLTGTDLPIVAVVSESMDHGFVHYRCSDAYKLCGSASAEPVRGLDFDGYWNQCGQWYEERSISKEEFSDFRFPNGFSKGDIILLRGMDPEKIEVGDVIVFASGKEYPIIHRVVAKEDSGRIVFETKGDHNEVQIQDEELNELLVQENYVIGVAVARVPYVGWVKLAAVSLFSGFPSC